MHQIVNYALMKYLLNFAKSTKERCDEQCSNSSCSILICQLSNSWCDDQNTFNMSKSWCVVIGNVNEYCVGFKKVVKKSLLKASLVNKSQPKCDNVRIDHVEDTGRCRGSWMVFVPTPLVLEAHQSWGDSSVHNCRLLIRDDFTKNTIYILIKPLFQIGRF